MLLFGKNSSITISGEHHYRYHGYNIHGVGRPHLSFSIFEYPVNKKRQRIGNLKGVKATECGKLYFTELELT